MVTSNRAWSDLPIPPGELLDEELNARGMTQHELAVRTGRPVQAINEIIRGRKSITHETALEFERVLGIPAQLWVNLEGSYQLTKAKLKEQKDLLNQESWLDQFPVKEMEKLGWLPRESDRPEKVRALLSFLGYVSFETWRNAFQAIEFRITAGSKVSEPALACWLRRGELEALTLETGPYHEDLFRRALSEIRGLTRLQPEEFFPQAQQLCANGGVAFLVVPQLPRSGANGAARWLGSSRALIELSLRYSWNDVFWFTFFHEAWHLLRRRTRQVHIDGLDTEGTAEAEADAFATDFLIPPNEWRDFRRLNTFRETTIREFADRIGIAPGIVVGRMQHEGIIPHSYLNGLRVRFKWIE